MDFNIQGCSQPGCGGLDRCRHSPHFPRRLRECKGAPGAFIGLSSIKLLSWQCPGAPRCPLSHHRVPFPSVSRVITAVQGHRGGGCHNVPPQAGQRQGGFHSTSPLCPLPWHRFHICAWLELIGESQFDPCGKRANATGGHRRPSGISTVCNLVQADCRVNASVSIPNQLAV